MPTDKCQHLCDSFAEFFKNKIRDIKTAIKLKLANNTSANDPMMSDVRHTSQLLCNLQPPSVDEVSKLINSMPAKSSVIDSIPTSVIKLNADIFAFQ